MKRTIEFARFMGDSWTRTPSSEYIDIHRELFPYERVLEFFEQIESESNVLKYCNGANVKGRWIFQIYSIEFVNEIADLLNNVGKESNPHKTILEVMSGDGRLTEFLKPLVNSNIIATDARKGIYGIEYPKWVENLDAIEALQIHNPDVVILGWEPFYSSVGLEIVETGIPTMWIGDRKHSAVHSGLFDKSHTSINSKYALGRHDSFIDRRFGTDVYLFNWQDL